MRIFVTGPSFNANMALAHALQERLEEASIRIVEWGHEPEGAADARWLVVAPMDLPEDTPWPTPDFAWVDAALSLDRQVAYVFEELGVKP